MHSVVKYLKKHFKFPAKFLSLYIGISVLVVFIYFYLFHNLPTPYRLKNYRSIPLSTHIYDRNGKLLYEIYREQNRTPVKLKDLPKYTWQAAIAVEDKEFFQHKGVSLIGGILRAAKETVIKKNLQGGSTITQQLVKSALLTPERTIRRKLREIILALWTEKIFTKQEILELYLNQVPYGGSSYGIEEASKTYFGKPAKKLKLEEAALLAGLPQAPSLYSPYINPDLALRRRNEVLNKMTEQGYVTEAQGLKAQNTSLHIIAPKTTIKAPHFVFYVKSELEKIYGIKEVEEGGLSVTTTLDLDLQEETEEILKEELEEVVNLRVTNGGILVTRPPTGEILTMVGSKDYFATGSGAFNVTTALRQPGSSIKPINYAIGIERKLVTPASIFLDSRTCFNDPGQPKAYCPVNYDGTFHGAVSLRSALANSYNIPAVKMMALNGVKNFVASSSAFGITSFKDSRNYGLSLTLGGGEVPMTEMAQAFSSFANRGKVKNLISILKVENKNKKVIYEFKDNNFTRDIEKPIKNPNFLTINGKEAISQETAFLISHILSDNAARSAAFGTSSFLVVPRKTVSVKTGTTDDKKDNWTIGYTPNFLTVVWVGNNDNTPMHPYLASGITGAAPIWNRVMTYLLKNQPDLKPIKPDTVIGRYTCASTGAGASKDQEGGCGPRYEYIIKGTEPKALSTKREVVWVTKDSDKLSREGDPNSEPKEKTIIRDAFSIYCLDCAGDQPQPSPTPNP
jgi:penicillin-binding protein 1C